MKADGTQKDARRGVPRPVCAADGQLSARCASIQRCRWKGFRKAACADAQEIGGDAFAFAVDTKLSELFRMDVGALSGFLREVAGGDGPAQARQENELAGGAFSEAVFLVWYKRELRRIEIGRAHV